MNEQLLVIPQNALIIVAAVVGVCGAVSVLLFSVRSRNLSQRVFDAAELKAKKKLEATQEEDKLRDFVNKISPEWIDLFLSLKKVRWFIAKEAIIKSYVTRRHLPPMDPELFQWILDDTISDDARVTNTLNSNEKTRLLVITRILSPYVTLPIGETGITT